MPSTLPPSATGITSTTGSSSASGNPPLAADGTPHPQHPGKPQYVISQSGHAAHPDDIVASCRALQAHIAKLQADAEKELKELDDRIKARELAEKRRVAPGWLDSDARLLEPEKLGGGDGNGNGLDLVTGGAADGNGGVDGQLQALSLADGAQYGVAGQLSEMAAHDDEGAQMDRAFGSLPLRPA